jgi:hypothetical protein
VEFKIFDLEKPGANRASRPAVRLILEPCHAAEVRCSNLTNPHAGGSRYSLNSPRAVDDSSRCHHSVAVCGSRPAPSIRCLNVRWRCCGRRTGERLPARPIGPRGKTNRPLGAKPGSAQFGHGGAERPEEKSWLISRTPGAG